MESGLTSWSGIHEFFFERKEKRGCFCSSLCALSFLFYKKFWPVVGLFRSSDLLSFRLHYSFWEVSYILLGHICFSLSEKHLSVYGKVPMVITLYFHPMVLQRVSYVDIREEEGVSAR